VHVPENPPITQDLEHTPPEEGGGLGAVLGLGAGGGGLDAGGGGLDVGGLDAGGAGLDGVGPPGLGPPTQGGVWEPAVAPTSIKEPATQNSTW